MKTKFFSVFIALAMLLALVPNMVGAAYGTQYGDCLYYEVNNDGTGVTITDCDETATEVVIPNEIDGLPVTAIGDYAFRDCSSLVSVTIPDSVTSIGKNAFEYCGNLKSITIPNGVTSIGDHAFEDCDSLAIISFGSGITSIGNHAFEDCDSLAIISFGSGITSIGNNAFYNCRSLASVTIPDSVTNIGNDAFSGCYNLESITIPDSVTSIGLRAFSYCDRLEEIEVSPENKSYCSVDGSLFSKDKTKLIQYATGKNDISYIIPDSVTNIVNNAFSDCYSLESVTIPDSVINIVSNAFSCCYSLEEIEVSPENKSYCSVGGNLFNKDKTELIQYAIGKTDISYTIPSGVTTIGKRAFFDCYCLESVTIPSGVTTIDDYAFSECDNLASVTIPDSVISIGSKAFYECDNLASVTIPDSVTSIGNAAFIKTTYSKNPNNWINEGLYIGNHLIDVKSSSGKEYSIKEGTKTIAENAFSNIYKLESVTIPESVTSISNGAFSGCSNLTDINVDENNQNYCSVNGNLFNKDKTTLIQYATGKADTSYIILDGVKIIGNGAFYYCENLLNVTIPLGVAIIGKEAFGGCDSLTSVKIPNSVTSIGEDAFLNCYRLRSVTIGSGVKSIGDGAFSICSALTDVYYKGTQKGWDTISIGYANSPLKTAKLHFEDAAPVENTVVNSYTNEVETAVEESDSAVTVTVSPKEGAELPESLDEVQLYIVAYGKDGAVTSVKAGKGVVTADGKIVVTAGKPTGESYKVMLWNGNCEPIIMPIEK